MRSWWMHFRSYIGEAVHLPADALDGDRGNVQKRRGLFTKDRARYQSWPEQHKQPAAQLCPIAQQRFCFFYESHWAVS